MLKENKEKGKEDQRTRISKILIRQSFLSLLKEKPIHDISVKEICESAEINRGTFYSYYRDANDLLKKIEDEMISKFEEAFKDFLESKEQSLASITNRIFELIKENADLCKAILSPHGDRRFANKMISIGKEKYLSMYVSAFPTVSKRKLDTYYTFVSMGCVGLIEEWVKDDLSTKTSVLSEAAESIMLQGIGYLLG